MGDMNNYGFKQVVTEGELDGSFENLNEGERALAQDAGCNQDSSEPSHYGGIASGLVVTIDAGNVIDITAGSARDEQGRRVALPTAASIAVTHIGDTPTGETDAVYGDGADISGSCGVNKLIIATLSIVYDELLTDKRWDGAGAEYYFEIAESFHFHIDLGTQFDNPPTAQPPRPSLQTGQIVLTDLLMLNDAGTMYVIGVMPSSAEWYALDVILSSSYFHLLDGRRADICALDDADDFAMWRSLEGAAGINFRGSTREALYALAKQLGNTTFALNEPTGAMLVGLAAVSGAEDLDGFEALELSEGNLSGAIVALVGAVNKKLNKGPDLRQAFFDDFIYTPEDSSRTWDPSTNSEFWRGSTSGGGVIELRAGGHGGWVILQTGGSAGSTVIVHTVYDGALGSVTPWNTSASYGARARIRCAVVSADVGPPPLLTDLEVYIGFITPGAGKEHSIYIDETGAVKPYGTTGGAGDTLLTVDPLEVMELELEAVGPACTITNLLTGDTAYVACDAGGNAYFSMQAKSKSGGVNNAVALYVDTVSISDYTSRPPTY